jgi:hypothetical protein
VCVFFSMEERKERKKKERKKEKVETWKWFGTMLL